MPLKRNLAEMNTVVRYASVSFALLVSRKAGAINAKRVSVKGILFTSSGKDGVIVKWELKCLYHPYTHISRLKESNTTK
jgi:hypothetical protein